MKYVTNNKHFNLFVKSCKYWLEQFGMSDWRVHYEHKNTPENDSLSWVQFNTGSRVAMICLAKDWGTDKPTDQMIKETAVHEVFELLLAKLSLAPFNRGVEAEEVEEEIHIIVRRWENYIKKTGQLK